MSEKKMCSKTKIVEYGTKYSFCFFIPARLFHDSQFPFTKKDELNMEVVDKHTINIKKK